MADYFIHTLHSCFQDQLGINGVERNAFKYKRDRAAELLSNIHEKLQANHFPSLTLYEDDDPKLEAILELATKIQSRFTHMVVLGTGGSTLCGQALLGLFDSPDKDKAKVEIHFADNIDSHSLEYRLNELPLKDTLFLAISKSGNTVETITELTLVIQTLTEQMGKEALKEHIYILSDPIEKAVGKQNAIHEIAAHFDIPMLEHEPEIGGRYAIFTNVGLLPAAVRGMDIRALLQGARELRDGVLTGRNPEMADAVGFHLSFMQKGISANVMMPYIDRLAPLTRWIKQLWAESLGKQGSGTTPIEALGTIDQHSQLQLYLDGPKDKVFTLILLNQSGEGIRLKPEFLPTPLLDYLKDRTVGTIMQSAQIGTRDSLMHHNLPVRTLTFDTLDEATLGALAMHFMIETITVGMGLGVNPFDQPAVEDGKKRMRHWLIERGQKNTSPDTNSAQSGPSNNSEAA